MSLVFKDALFDAQWLRAAGHSTYGGAEISECFVAARSVREPDGESWYRSWNELAMRVRAEGDASLAHDNRVSALGSYLQYRGPSRIQEKQGQIKKTRYGHATNSRPSPALLFLVAAHG